VDTAVGVTVLQHAMEAHHPLNSTRVARLGLLNLAVAQVTDVNHRAHFILTTLEAGGAAASGLGCGPRTTRSGNIAFPRDLTCGKSDGEVVASCGFEDSGLTCSGDLGVEDNNFGGEVGSPGCAHNGSGSFGFKKMKSDGQSADLDRPSSVANETGNSVVDSVNGESNHISEVGVTHKVNGNHSVVANGSEVHRMVNDCNGIGVENVEVGGQDWTRKSMDKCTIAFTEKELRINIERGVKPKIRWLSRGPLGEAAVSNGFVVTKIQMKTCKLTGEVTEFEEFSITVPPKSALLFPCQRAISIDASGCQVQHLIVLDGTWAKAQRMYHENPWLQLLPHVKLESDRVSLYSEVRHEPRAGCLSTIESIVVAMKKLGEDSKGLDDLLDVFESMIADQRRCKDENVKQKLMC
jgi:DTW domain-containing protein YfiP